MDIQSSAPREWNESPLPPKAWFVLLEFRNKNGEHHWVPFHSVSANSGTEAVDSMLQHAVRLDLDDGFGVLRAWTCPQYMVQEFEVQPTPRYQRVTG